MVVKIWACHFGLSQQSSRWFPMFHEGHACFIFRVKVTIETAGSPVPLLTTNKTTKHHHSENHILRNSSILVLLKSCLQTCMTYTIAECTVNKLMMMDRRTVRNTQSFTTK